jgi:hypothetical protein
LERRRVHDIGDACAQHLAVLALRQRAVPLRIDQRHDLDRPIALLFDLGDRNEHRRAQLLGRLGTHARTNTGEREHDRALTHRRLHAPAPAIASMAKRQR